MQDMQTVIRNAVAWARERLGDKDYAGMCLAFVEDAIEQANGVEIFGGDSAKESAELYGARENVGEPPLGAFVFYDCGGLVDGVYRDWGHVGLCIGEGRVIHAYGEVRIDPYTEIPCLPAFPDWSQPAYVGWTPIERVFRQGPDGIRPETAE